MSEAPSNPPRRKPGRFDSLFGSRRRPKPRPGPPGLPSTDVRTDDAASTEFITVAVSGATVIARPRPSTTIAGKNDVQ